MQAPKVEESDRLMARASTQVSRANHWRRPLLIFVAFSLLVCAFLYASVIDWARFAISKDRNTYLLLVPIISAYLIRTRRQELKVEPDRSVLAAIITASIGVIALACTSRTSQPLDRLSLHIFALLNFLLAGGFLIFGLQFLRQLVFPIAFLIFAVPVPSVVSERIEIFLQYTSAEAAYWLISLIGIPMIRDTVNFRLPNINLQVAQECSGYNSTFALFMVSTVAGYLFLKSPSKRTILSLAVIPLAILRNGFRVTTLAALCVYVDPELIHSYIHHKGGPIFFALSLIPFFLILWALRRSETPNARTKRT